MSERPPEIEVVTRPDLEAVLADEKTKELIEEYEAEARTRTFTGWWDRLGTAPAVATTLFALYFAAARAGVPFTNIVLLPAFPVLRQENTTPQIYVMSFLTAIPVPP